jgi:hypothetical protein
VYGWYGLELSTLFCFVLWSRNGVRKKFGYGARPGRERREGKSSGLRRGGYGISLLVVNFQRNRRVFHYNSWLCPRCNGSGGISLIFSSRRLLHSNIM